ncbi:hypothetical protein QCA50_013324 [Cerrena zonata]|uniref:GH18 domain-containing protein n=1 Tax=Cerrena zonata TaxID=2478898 RepID=A0AAW0FQC0_9APHY
MLHMLPLSLIALLPLTTSVWAAPACSVRVASSTASATAAASSATGSVQSSGNSNSTNGRVALAWYAGWSASTSPPSGLSWSKYTHMQFSFGITAPGGQVSLELSDEDGTVLPNFVKVAQQNNVKAILTIGGWTGSQYFSSAVATNDSRAQFIDTLTGLVTKYDLDGLDFDWEYPNALGIGCNEKSPQDTENYLQFLTELRATDVMQGKVMSAATSITPFFDSNGQPSSDVSGFAKVLDHISIMNYDVYGNWSSADGVGPLAPLDDTCGVPGQLGSATSAVKLWTDAGFPASQIVLGVAAYGRSFFVTDADATATSNSATSNSSLEALPQGAFAIAAYPSFNPAQQPMGDSRDANGTDTGYLWCYDNWPFWCLELRWHDWFFLERGWYGSSWYRVQIR